MRYRDRFAVALANLVLRFASKQYRDVPKRAITESLEYAREVQELREWAEERETADA